MPRSIYPSNEAGYSALPASRHQTARFENQTGSPMEELSECPDHSDLKTSSDNAPSKRSRTPLQKPWVWVYDTFQYLANGVHASRGTFKNTLLNQTYNLTGLTLNISTYYLPAVYAHPSKFEEKFNQYENDAWAGDPSNARYTLSSVNDTPIFNAQQILENGVCQPQKEYNWGFSGLLLFWTVLITTIWGIEMWTIYLDASFHSELVKYGSSMGRYRAAVDFVEVTEQNLGHSGNTESLSDAHLGHRLAQAIARPTIDYIGVTAEKKAATLADRTGRLRVAPVLSPEYWLHSKALGPYDID